ncbi:MAG TPA: YicC/YloC family endoribonuclease [Cytophagales bacterium]|nr:YicC/YloC family endoribonuclease [Cytophagales bacterium]
MIKSMTGFGKAVLENENSSIVVEVKSLNSKFLDASIRLPKQFSDKEIEVRTLLNNVLQRGKVNLSIDYVKKGEVTSKVTINQELIKKYYQELLLVAQEIGTSSNDLFRMALQMPDAIITKGEESNPEEWTALYKTINEALQACEKFRIEEGRGLSIAIIQNIEKIKECLLMVEQQDPQRIINLKSRLRNQLKELIESGQHDENRFEQELIYYIEKLDINEEKVRLNSHLNYFLETLTEPGAQGKKLGFITQEIGREINTIGSKANDAEIQKNVVVMKEELEKIKEQINNLL